MPRAATISHPLMRLYFREVRLPATTEMVSRSILNRWFAYLQGSCDAKCCAHRTGTMDLHEATKVDVLDFVHHMNASKLSVATKNNNIIKLRAFYRWAVASDLNEGMPNPAQGVKLEKPQTNIQPVMDDATYERLMKACGRTKEGRRDKAILSMLRLSGLRRAEICALDLASYRDDVDRPAVVVGTVEHSTKTRKARLVPISHETAALIDRYLLPGARGQEAGPLFMSQRGERLTPAGVSQLFDRAMKRAGIADAFGVHSFRRAWAIEARRSGLSDAAIMDIAGWDDPMMIVRYTKSASTDLAHDEYYAKMAGQAKPKATRKAQPGRYGRKAA